MGKDERRIAAKQTRVRKVIIVWTFIHLHLGMKADLLNTIPWWSSGATVLVVSKCWQQSVPDWTLAYSFLEYLGYIFNRIHLNALARNHRTPFHIYPTGVDVWINVHDCAWSNLSNHGSNSSQGNHGNHSACRRFSESSGYNVGGTRFCLTRRHTVPSDRNKELRGHRSGDPRAA